MNRFFNLFLLMHVFCAPPEDGGGGSGTPQTSGAPTTPQTSGDKSTEQTSQIDTSKLDPAIAAIITKMQEENASLKQQAAKGAQTLKEIQEKGEKKRLEELAKQGEFKKLYEESDGKFKALDEQNKQLATSLQYLMNKLQPQLPDQTKKLFQTDPYKDNPLKQLEMLKQLEDAGFFKVDAGKGDGAKPSTSSSVKGGLDQTLKDFYKS